MRRIICRLLGHQYFVVQEFGPVQRRVGCRRCRGEWAMHDGVQAFLPWDGDFTELYRSSGYYLLKW